MRTCLKRLQTSGGGRVVSRVGERGRAFLSLSSCRSLVGRGTGGTFRLQLIVVSRDTEYCQLLENGAVRGASSDSAFSG